MKSSSYSGAARPRKRTGADHFGLFTLFLLLAASLALYIRLMATGMLSNLYLIILMVVLIVLNAVSVIVQLPLRRNKAGKLIMGIVSLLLSGAMLYGVVAVNSVQSALSKIVGKMTETEITEVRVMNDNPATSMETRRAIPSATLPTPIQRTRRASSTRSARASARSSPRSTAR